MNDSAQQEVALRRGAAQRGERLEHLLRCRANLQREALLLGGAGVSNTGCGEFGFGMIDATAGRDRVHYFFLANKTHDRFDEVCECIEANGVGDCVHFAELWRDQPL